jgi:Na+-transporting NADH:ubiquinone oxidoreductase subunit B
MTKKRLLDHVKPIFDKGGKLEKLYPVYDALDTFLYTPGHVTHSGSHIRDAVDLKRTMITVIFALLPALFFGMWNLGYQHALAIGLQEGNWDHFLFGAFKALPLIVVSYGAGLTAEFIFCIVKKHAIQEGFLVSGLLIPMIMPVEVPLWMLAVCTVLAVVVAKEVFGGTGMNIFNVALMTRAMMFFAYPTKMSGDKVWIATDGEKVIDGFSGATALGDLASLTGTQPSLTLAQIVEKYPLWDSFIGTIPGSIGETSALCCLIGGFILVATGIGSLRTMLSFFLGGLAMSFLFNIWGANEYMNLAPIHQLMLGGFMFGGVFMITDPVTAAQTANGKIIYGFLAGFLAIMIRVFNPAYPEGVMMAILFMNAMAPLIDHYVVQANITKRLNRVKK